MQQDDRLMSLLTAFVVIIAIGTLAVSGPSIVSGLRSKEPLVLRQDEAIVRTGEVRSLEVLVNDDGVDEQDRDNLMIMTRPACGEAMVSAGTITYIGGPECLGRQAFSYCVSRDGICPEAVVNLMVMRAGEEPVVVMAAPTNGNLPVAPVKPAKRAPLKELPIAPKDLTRAAVDPVPAEAEGAAGAQKAAESSTQGFELYKPEGPRAPAFSPVPRRFGGSGGGRTEASPAGGSSEPVLDSAAPFVSSPATPTTPPAPSIDGGSGLSDLKDLGIGQTAYAGQSVDSPSGAQAAATEATGAAEQPGPVVAALTPEFSDQSALTGSAVDATGLAALSTDTTNAKGEGEGISPNATIGSQAFKSELTVGETEADPLADSPSPTAGAAPAELARAPAPATAPDIDEGVEAFAGIPVPPNATDNAPLVTAALGATPVIEAPESDPLSRDAGPEPGETPEELVVMALLVQPGADHGDPGVVVDAPYAAPQMRSDGDGVLAADAVVGGDELDLKPDTSRPTISGLSSRSKPEGDTWLVAEIAAGVLETWRGETAEPEAISTAGHITPASPPASGAGVAERTYQTEEALVAATEPEVKTTLTAGGTKPQGEVLALATPAPNTVADCRAAEVSVKARPAAMVEISVDDPCVANGVARIVHADIPFSLQLDEAGRGAVSIPAMTVSAELAVVLADGDVRLFDVATPDADRLSRVALVWSDPVDLDLHAFEYGAAPGGDGHVWSGAPRDFSNVRRNGGGFINSYPAPEAGGASVEIYSFWKSRRARAGAVTLALDFADRGLSPKEPFCGDGSRSSPNFRVYRSEDGVLSRPTGGVLAAVDCGVELSGASRFNRRAVRDLVID